jgi:hypothetical protein
MGDRLNRLRALLQYGQAPDETLIHDEHRVDRARHPDQTWLNAHANEVRSALAALLAQTGRVGFHATADPPAAAPADGLDGEPDDSWSWLRELDQDYRAGILTSATMAYASQVVKDLRATPPVRSLDHRHRVHAA